MVVWRDWRFIRDEKEVKEKGQDRRTVHVMGVNDSLPDGQKLNMGDHLDILDSAHSEAFKKRHQEKLEYRIESFALEHGVARAIKAEMVSAEDLKEKLKNHVESVIHSCELLDDGVMVYSPYNLDTTFDQWDKTLQQWNCNIIGESSMPRLLEEIGLANRDKLFRVEDDAKEGQCRICLEPTNPKEPWCPNCGEEPLKQHNTSPEITSKMESLSLSPGSMDLNSLKTNNL